MKILMKSLWGILFNGLVFWLLTLAVVDIQYTGGFKFFLVAGVVLGAFNFFIKPVLKLLALPIVVMTGGLFYIVINVFVLWFLSYFISIAEFRDITLVFPNFGTYVIGAIVFGLINWILNLIIK
jgi:putative membrane protein